MRGAVRNNRALRGWRGEERLEICAKLEVEDGKTNVMWKRKVSSVLFIFKIFGCVGSLLLHAGFL